MQTDIRLESIRHWLTHDLALPLERLEPASADASFRRYFRASLGDGRSRVVMDAPPDKEDIGPYLRVSALLEGCGLHVPAVFAVDAPRGFILLEDLGRTPLLTQLGAGTSPDRLYGSALDALAMLQLRGGAAARELAPYDAPVLAREMALMPEWFLGRHLGLAPDAATSAMLEAAFTFLVREALAQPRVFVHRDYHSRNLMVLPERSPGVIDFQDALEGPVGYDLVSLLKDCYVGWPRERVTGWVRGFRERLLAGGGAALAGSDDAQFLRWFDAIGLQRHIKVLGIFARLNWRDGKPGYLADLPLTLAYVREAAALFPELAAFPFGS